MSCPNAVFEENPHLWEKWEKRFEELAKQYPLPQYDIIMARFRDLEHFRFHLTTYCGWEEAETETVTE